MIKNNPQVIVNILQKDFPDVAERITEKIKGLLPNQTLTDINKVKLIIECFGELKGVSNKDIEYRKELIALLMMLYDPSKLFGLKTCNLKRGISEIIIDHFKVGRITISKNVNEAIFSFKAYKDFREEVYRLYHYIIEDQQLFK